jgi:hypothetical protein
VEFKEDRLPGKERRVEKLEAAPPEVMLVGKERSRAGE